MSPTKPLKIFLKNSSRQRDIIYCNSSLFRPSSMLKIHSTHFNPPNFKALGLSGTFKSRIHHWNFFNSTTKSLKYCQAEWSKSQKKNNKVFSKTTTCYIHQRNATNSSRISISFQWFSRLSRAVCEKNKLRKNQQNKTASGVFTVLPANLWVEEEVRICAGVWLKAESTGDCYQTVLTVWFTRFRCEIRWKELSIKMGFLVAFG